MIFPGQARWSFVSQSSSSGSCHMLTYWTVLGIVDKHFLAGLSKKRPLKKRRQIYRTVLNDFLKVVLQDARLLCFCQLEYNLSLDTQRLRKGRCSLIWVPSIRFGSVLFKKAFQGLLGRCASGRPSLSNVPFKTAFSMPFLLERRRSL